MQVHCTMFWTDLFLHCEMSNMVITYTFIEYCMKVSIILIITIIIIITLTNSFLSYSLPTVDLLSVWPVSEASDVDLHVLQWDGQQHGRPALPGLWPHPISLLPHLPPGVLPIGAVLQCAAGCGQPLQQGFHDHARCLFCQHGHCGPCAQPGGTCGAAELHLHPLACVGVQQRGLHHPAHPLQYLFSGHHVFHHPAQSGLLHRASAASHIHVQRVQHQTCVRFHLGRCCAY